MGYGMNDGQGSMAIMKQTMTALESRNIALQDALSMKHMMAQQLNGMLQHTQKMMIDLLTKSILVIESAEATAQDEFLKEAKHIVSSFHDAQKQVEEQAKAQGRGSPVIASPS
jgi:hypothetical protein